MADRFTGRERPFRILVLNGGGVRGVFQARYLERLEDHLGGLLADHIDLVAGTSTGALVGTAVSLGVSAVRVREMYERHAEDIFRQRPLAGLRRGPRYQTDRLRTRLEALFGTKRMSDVIVPLLVPSATVDTHQPKVFGPKDANLALVDIALASAAAPTYFAPHRVTTDARAFYDGGLWANDPSVIALSYARDYLHVGTEDIRMITVGTGQVSGGNQIEELRNLRPISLQSLRVLYEMVSTLQSAAVQESVLSTLSESARLLVNPELPHRVPLDAARKSLQLLPPIADDAFDRTKDKAHLLLTQPFGEVDLARQRARTADPVAIRGIAEANLKTFIPERKFYAKFRDGHGSISDYISLAQHEIVLVSVNLMTGESFEGILEAFRKMLSRPDGRLTAKISLLDPRQDHLIKAISGSIGLPAADIARQIEALTEKARLFRSELGKEARERFTVHWHSSLPSASAILSDAFEKNGRIQLETKAYRSPTNKAFGFEVGAGSDFFETLRSAYYNLIEDGELAVPGIRSQKGGKNV